MRPVADRVKETSTTTGTGTLNLAGPATGFRSFVDAGFGDVSRVPYCIEDGTDWEVGYGLITDATPDTLAREEVVFSSNSDALVNFGAGTKNVFLTLITPEVMDRGKIFALVTNTPTV